MDIAIPPQRSVDPISGKLLVVIDDDDLVLDSMRGLLKSWDCEVIASESEQAMLVELGQIGRRPDLIISDYHLARGSTGFELIERLRRRFGANIPAFLISGDTAPERLREAAASGYHLLHKPVPPMVLRAMLSQLMRRRRGNVSSKSASGPSPVSPP